MGVWIFFCFVCACALLEGPIHHLSHGGTSPSQFFFFSFVAAREERVSATWGVLGV